MQDGPELGEGGCHPQAYISKSLTALAICRATLDHEYALQGLAAMWTWLALFAIDEMPKLKAALFASGIHIV